MTARSRWPGGSADGPGQGGQRPAEAGPAAASRLGLRLWPGCGLTPGELDRDPAGVSLVDRRRRVGHLGDVAAIEEAVTAWPAVAVAGASHWGVRQPGRVTQGQAAASRMEEWLGVGSEADAGPA